MHLIDDEWKDRRCAAAVHPDAEAAAAGKSGEAAAADDADADAALLLHADVAAALVPPLHAPLLIAVRVHCRCIIVDRVEHDRNGTASSALRLRARWRLADGTPADRRHSSSGRRGTGGEGQCEGTAAIRHALKRSSADVSTDCTATRPVRTVQCAVPHRSPLL